MLLVLLVASALAGFGLLQGVTYWHKGNIPRAIFGVGGALFLVSAVTMVGTITAVENYIEKVMSGQVQIERQTPQAQFPPYRGN